MNKSGVIRLVVLAAIVVGAVVLLRSLPIAEALPGILAWVKGLGWVGAVVFAAAYVVGTVIFFPGSILTLSAGFLFGPFWGTVIASPASVLGATAAFVLGKTVARNWVAGKVESSPRFAALQSAIGREGTKILMLVRLSPVFPFSLVNYAFGLTKISLRGYILGSWIAMLPGTFLYVYLGSLIPDAASIASGARPAGQAAGAQQYLLWIGLAATALVVVFVTRTARKALAKAAPELGASEQ
ncbi:MAG: TVP38/TMEM64 family protein [Thermoanaerobaculia bacterium]